MITATITSKYDLGYTTPEESRDMVESDMVESARLEPGCIIYQLYASTENKDVLLMLEHWKNPALSKVHLQTEHFNAFGAAIEEIITEESDMGIHSVDKKIILVLF